MRKKPIHVLELNGTPFELGQQHGEACREAIHQFSIERTKLVMSGEWSGGQALSREAVLELAEACLPAHRIYAPDLFDEMRGLATATGLSLGELVITGGFTDFIDTVYNQYGGDQRSRQTAMDDCTAFIIPDEAADGAGFLGQTWDMHAGAHEFVVMLRIKPGSGPGSLVYTTTGCLGQIGMNEHGIAVGINNLEGADGEVGVTWPFVVRKILQQDNLEAALECITSAPLAGAHNYLLFDKEGRGYNVEAMSSRMMITSLNQGPIVHTNHCLFPQTLEVSQERLPEAQESSENRLTFAGDWLEKPQITIDDLFNLTRQDPVCVRSTPPLHIETCGAAIMRPKTRDLWAVQGMPTENEYESFRL